MDTNTIIEILRNRLELAKIERAEQLDRWGKAAERRDRFERDGKHNAAEHECVNMDVAWCNAQFSYGEACGLAQAIELLEQL